MTYKEALKALDEFLLAVPSAAKTSKNTLRSVFELYPTFRPSLAATTVKKKKTIFGKRLGVLADRDISKIERKHLQDIADEIFREKLYASLDDYCEFVHQLWGFARKRGILKKDIFDGILLKESYDCPPSEGYAWISDQADLESLISYVLNYRSPISSIKKALIMGLATGLRAGNVRKMSANHLKIDENGEFYLYFPKDENKTKTNGDEYLGLPREVGEWLLSFNLKGSQLFFGNTKGKPLSDRTLSNVLGDYCSEKLGDNVCLVFHSFRKIASTFCHENMPQNGLIPYEVERTLFHAIHGVAGVYNKSTNIAMTRKVITWWFNYLKSLGLAL